MSDIIISDLSVCQPSDRLDRGYRYGTWRLIDYETEGFAGTMVYSGPGMGSEPLTLPLNRQGYYRIYLGVHYQFHGDAHVRVRLSDDPAYTLVRAECQSAKDLGGIPEELGWCHTNKVYSDNQVPEAFWKVADLTGQALIISRFNEGRELGEMFSNLVHVRLVPMSDEELAEYQRELPGADTRRLVAMNDGGIFKDIRTKEDIWSHLEPYRDSDVAIMLWATFKGENCTYRSRIGRPLPTEHNPFDRFAYADRWDDNLRALEDQGIDFMTELVEAAHSSGLRIFPSLRLQTANQEVPRDMAPGSFSERHPEFHCRYKNGGCDDHLSLAFPEVRQFWISLLCEALAYGFDGVHVIFCRSAPFVFYEEPVIQRFREAYGEDPRECPDDDPRLAQVHCTFVTEFARELKEAVTAMSTTLGKPLEIAYSVYTFIEGNLRWGIDLETLVREGLVDYLMPHPAFVNPPWHDAKLEWLKPLVELVKGTSVKLYPDLYPRRQPPAASLYSVDELYDLGCGGVTLWDTFSRVFRISEWAMLKRLGHQEQVKEWRAAGKGNDYFRVINFTSVGDTSKDSRFVHADG